MKSGIYLILNTQTARFYVGRSNDIRKRVSGHRCALKTGQHPNHKLQSDWVIQNGVGFIFSVLHAAPKFGLIELEQTYINRLTPFYNISVDALAPMGGRKHTAASRRRMSESQKVRPKGSAHPNFGRRPSIETRRKLSLAVKGRKHSSETIQKMRATAKRKGNGSRVAGKNKKAILDSMGNGFLSLTQAAIFHEISIQAICDNLKGRSKKCRKGVHFRYA